MKSIEIIVHCWAGQLPQYAHAVRYQLSSLVKYPPTVPVTYTVFCDRDDALVAQVLGTLGPRVERPCRVRAWTLPRTQLMRRAIGRNLAAQVTTADIVWFAGCDYVFGQGCLDNLAMIDPFPDLAFPREYMIHRNHATGDRALKLAAEETGTVEVVEGEFISSLDDGKHDRAIGCLQIVCGDIARKFGYLPGTQWQRPEPIWRRTEEDPAYRRSIGQGRGTPIHMTNLYRLRHSKAGRDAEAAA